MPSSTLPLVLAGPILRRLTSTRLTFWLACTSELQCQLKLSGPIDLSVGAEQMAAATTRLELAQHLHLLLIDLPLSEELPLEQRISYDLQLKAPAAKEWQSCQQWAPELCYAGHRLPFFQLQPKVRHLLHGSCRKGHYPSADGLVRADQYLAQCAPEQWPSLLMMSGDQIYADDVSVPKLYAIHQLIERLGFADEALPCADIRSSHQLHREQPYYGQRQDLLPDTKAGNKVIEQVFKGAKKPIFTSDSAQNHLISFAEVCCMYLLVWSRAGWDLIQPQVPPHVLATLPDKQREKALKHQTYVNAFAAGLNQVQRLMAHLPVAMIFDDHDVTDDWNLTAEWEKTAYGQPFSRRILGNALLGYALFQGWGNAPEQHQSLIPSCRLAALKPGSDDHDRCLDTLYDFKNWNYQWPTTPRLIVLDTRTQRWRSEEAEDLPSGLMDWKSITELQQHLLHLPAVLLVSPAPVFGVKLIEAVQHLFTALGHPLLVDAESWMAHSGAAYALMNLFRHPDTPQNFVILSGDVHYNFVFQIKMRGHAQSPNIWQITSCGLNNEFPEKLLKVFDHANRWLYAPWSPLNGFTKRRTMQVIHHKPKGIEAGRRLLNCAGIGLVTLSEQGLPEVVQQLAADGRTFDFDLEDGDAGIARDFSL